MPVLDRTGFRVIDLTGSSGFEIMIRIFREDPWEALDLFVQAAPRTRLRAGMRANCAVSFAVTPDALMDCWMRQLNRHGCRSFWIYDVLYNIDKMHRLAKVAKEFGSEVAGAVMYFQSPVHTLEYFTDKVRQLASSPDIDTILLYDTAGVLGRDQLSRLVPALKQAAGGKRLEFHANNILGQSARAYCDAVEFGVDILHTASRPMANSSSVPSTEIMVHNLELLGHTHSLKDELFAEVATYMGRVGKTAGLPVNQHNEYDVLAERHQIPGGMMGTLKAQLAQHKMSERLDEVLRETALVRKELGYPGMATPFSQLVGIQAVMNVVTGVRYGTIPDEVIQYACEWHGKPVAPIDENVLDKIMSAPRAKEIASNPPEQPTLEELHKRHGTRDDDELLLRALVPSTDIEKMRAAGPVKRTYPLVSSQELQQIPRLMQLSVSKELYLKTSEFSLRLSRD